MYIYNVTVNVAEVVCKEWLQWIQHVHIPDMLATKKFIKAQIVKVLVEEAMGGITYSIQYYVQDKHTLEKYYHEEAQQMKQKVLRKFGSQVVDFKTELEVIAVYEAKE